jgi:hypothetical protein
MAAKLTRTASGATSFWTVADFFRMSAKAWTPANAGYELWRAVEAGGTRWSVCMKVHAVPARTGPRGPLQFKASITLWPDGAARSRQTGAARAWPVMVRKHLGRVGYRGTWMKSPHGVFGDFWKELPGPAAVRREAKVLEALELPRGTNGRVVRRTRGAPRTGR